VTIESAGTGGWHVGNPPDPRAQAEALRHGVDISKYRARQVVEEDFVRFGQIFALDPQNLRISSGLPRAARWPKSAC
jgi:protein-tyrosine phosphatase